MQVYPLIFNQTNFKWFSKHQKLNISIKHSKTSLFLNAYNSGFQLMG